jgi:hypothetical protein
MLQNLANKPSYAKEAYMMTLNPFVENNKARINQFLNNLCEVGDFYDTLEVMPRLFWLVHILKSPHLDGSVYGAIQKGLDDTYYYERTIQHAFINPATHRDFGV